MHILNSSINTFLLLCFIAIQILSLVSANANNNSLKYDQQKTSTKFIFDLSENTNQTGEEKADNENSEDNFENLKLALTHQSPKKIINFKEIISSNLVIKTELLLSSVPNSPPNFC